MKKDENLNYKDYFWLFMVGGLFGYVFEIVWYFIRKHIWLIKNGVLFGPFQPIYGFGLVLITLLLYKQKNKPWYLIVFYGFLIGSAFEYITSLGQQYLLGTYSWNYTKFGKLSINGRIYLPYCLVWGFLALIWIKLLSGKLVNLFRKLPIKYNNIIVFVLTIFMIFNLSATSLVFYRKAARYNGNNNYSRLERYIDKHYNDDFLDKRFPNLWIKKK